MLKFLTGALILNAHAAQEPISFPDSMNSFAFELFKGSDKENGVLSPLSLYVALTMASEGAREKTRDQMNEVLGLNTVSLQGFKNFLKEVKVLNHVEWLMVNQMWGEKSYSFEKDFLKVLEQDYFSGLSVLDFSRQSEPSRLKINQWVSEKTKNKINNLLPENSVTPITKLLLTNAVHLKANWLERFEKSRTTTDFFYSSSEKKTKTQFLSDQRKVDYFENDQVQVVDLPYAGDELSMVLALPKPGISLKAIEEKLSLSQWSKWHRFSRHEVRLRIPKFKSESFHELSAVLKEMGMKLAFDENKANFSGIHSSKPLGISQVFHKTFIDVNEEGTEAAAATALATLEGAATSHQYQKEFIANRPFLYWIRHKKSGALLFLGRLNQPS